MLENMAYVTKALATIAMAQTFFKSINALQLYPPHQIYPCNVQTP